MLLGVIRVGPECNWPTMDHKIYAILEVYTSIVYKDHVVIYIILDTGWVSLFYACILVCTNSHRLIGMALVYILIF